MFPRYKLCCRLNNIIVFERYFSSITSVVKFCTGFTDDVYISIFDELTEKIFPDYYVRKLCKEFIYD